MKASHVVFIQHARKKKKKERKRKRKKMRQSRSLCAGLYLLALRLLDTLWKIVSSELNKHTIHVG